MELILPITIYLTLKKNIQHAINVKKIESNYAQNITTLRVSYKGKATDLWQSVPANIKQPFVVNTLDDSNINLNYKYTKLQLKMQIQIIVINKKYQVIMLL